jgi:hypothetical protein
MKPYHPLNIELYLNLDVLKREVLQFVKDRPTEVLNYKAWIDSNFKVNSPASDWISIKIDSKTQHYYFKPFFRYMKKKFDSLGSSDDDYVQFHVSNLSLNPSSVYVPPHRDVNRGAGINFGVYNFASSEICFYEDRRVTSGEIPASKSLMPKTEFLTQVDALEYQPNKAYIINAQELHNVHYLSSFKNDVRIVAAYALRKNNLDVNYSELIKHLIE